MPQCVVSIGLAYSGASATAAYPVAQTGSARLSYTGFLEMLNKGHIRRITFYDRGKAALIEKAVSGHDEGGKRPVRWRPGDPPFEHYLRELDEWEQEKIRYYVELPGDFWWTSDLANCLRRHLPHRMGNQCATCAVACSRSSDSRSWISSQPMEST